MLRPSSPNKALTATLAAITMAATACDSDEPLGYVCAPAVERALQVAVRDSVTGAPIAVGASGAITAPGYRDTLTLLTPEDPLWLASRRSDAGRFDVQVARAGYAVWLARGVEVVGGVCGVQVPTRIEARLRPLD